MVWGSTLSTSLFLYGHNLHGEMSASKGTHHCESGFQEVTHSSGATLGLCVTILDTSELEKRLDAGVVMMPVPRGVGINPRHESVSVWA